MTIADLKSLFAKHGMTNLDDEAASKILVNFLVRSVRCSVLTKSLVVPGGSEEGDHGE